jgi:indole-3-glycerol phosphate synthase
MPVNTQPQVERRSSILAEILDRRASDVEAMKQETPLDRIKEKALDAPRPRDFVTALRKRAPAVIAEFKRASPSAGVLREGAEPAETALMYERHGAAAVSVLTEPHYFNGSLNDLKEIRGRIQLPVLRKDFIVDPYQVYESRASGADAFLLIAAACATEQLRELIRLGNDLHMAPLVEVRDRDELDRAVRAGAKLIGINNRCLRTFTVDLNTTLDLAPQAPKDCTVVAESGFRSYEDLERCRSAGVQAFLIGTALMSARDPGEALKNLLEKR